MTNLDILHSPAGDVIGTVKQVKLVLGQELHYNSVDILQGQRTVSAVKLFKGEGGGGQG